MDQIGPGCDQASKDLAAGSVKLRVGWTLFSVPGNMRIEPPE
jgi:hypothetical protein